MKHRKFIILATGIAFALSTNPMSADEEVYTLTPEAQQEVDNIIQISKTDNLAAQNEFFTFIDGKKYKKELKKTKALIAAGQQFLKAGLYQQAAELGRLAYEQDGTNYDAVMLYGDATYELKDYGTASAKYEEATQIKPKEKSAYLKSADVYKYINPDYSLEILKKFKEKFPDDPDVNKSMGAIYYYQNKVAEAKQAYDTYFAASNGGDIEAQEQYAIILFAEKNYQASLDKVNEILPKNPKALSLNRMKFYNLMELMQTQAAKEASDKFFGMFTDTLYNATDYKYLGQLAEINMDTALMVKSYEKAFKLDPENKDVLVGLSEAYEKIGEADKSVEAYKKYIELTNPGSANGILKEGKIYYSCAAALEGKAEKNDLKKRYVEEGDKLFAKLEELAKESYLGPFWRARIQTIMDPENPIESVKDCYDKAYERLANKDESYNQERKECLVYTAFYFFKKDDYTQAADYCDKVLAIDPNHSLAKNIKSAIGQLKK
jgi:tetratricopeptide (TPR) repeat protein